MLTARHSLILCYLLMMTSIALATLGLRIEAAFGLVASAYLAGRASILNERRPTPLPPDLESWD